jgi:hypothetical protein
MTYYERKPEEREASVKRANAYLEETKREFRATLITIIFAVACIVTAIYGLVTYVGSVVDRDNVKFKEEVNQGIQFQADRSIKYYEELKARKGLK